MDWFKGKITGKPHEFHGKITLVSGEDVPFFTRPFNHRIFDTTTSVG